ncbi:MAG TPA: aldehyde ferredoxin oxidoreductase C-terminal domain-containing protein, partial [bacterium]|nr:aldehyde ferredoxin oxidoreductase C-terminal domain-containing protein [bacterium]
HASAIYGGSEFALSYGGNEMAGYHTGPAAHLGLLLGARHSHLDNAGYSVDQKIVMKKQTTPREIVDRIFEEEQWRQVLSSLVICFFARGIYTPEVVSETLGSAGFALSPDELSSIGKKIHFEKYAFKFREGFKLQEERLPGRIFETMSSAGRIDADFMKQAVEYAESVLGAAGAEESK